MKFHALAAVLVLLAGCSEAPAPEELDDEEPQETVDLGALPVWVEGTKWTYKTSGAWDGMDRFSVVVVNQTDGYLLAGASRSDLVDEVAWERLYLGEFDLDLQVLGPAGPRTHQLLQFPLQNGSSWSIYGMEVTAQEAPIAWQGEQGYVISGGEGNRIYIEYAPSVGFITVFESWSGDTLYEGIRLESVSTATSYSWVEVGAEAYGEQLPKTPAGLKVDADADSVLYWGFATAGSTGFALEPDGTLWELPGGSVVIEVRDAKVGEYRLSGYADSGGAVWLQAHELTWVDGTIG